jgi:hypothetical protein
MPMKIDRSEVALTGKWIPHNQGRYIADDVCARIDMLVRDHLQEIGRDQAGWDALYRDPVDGRFWELIHPQSEMHGGGPPQLQVLTTAEARKKYGDVVRVG